MFSFENIFSSINCDRSDQLSFSAKQYAVEQRLAIVDGRLYWVDALRAIAILFVVFGHTSGSVMFGTASGIHGWLISYIYSFHMPLFFFLSGFLLKEKALRSTFLFYLVDRLRKVMIPYFAFACLTYIPWVLVTRHYGYQAELNTSPLTPLIGIFYGTVNDNWLQHNTPLWFFPCLFVTQIVYYWIARLRRWPLIGVILVIFAVAGYFEVQLVSFRSPWSIDIAFTAIVFYGIGHLLRNNTLIANKPKATYILLFLLISLCLQALTLNFNLRPSMALGVYGNPALFFLGSFSGILFWVVAVKFIPVSKIILRVGRDAIVIFFLHVLMFSVITGIAVWVFRLPQNFGEGSLFVAFIYTFASISMLMPVAYLIRKYIPWLIGGR